MSTPIDEPWLPALRPEIRYEPPLSDGDGHGRLRDLVLRRGIDLGQVASAIVARLDGKRPVDRLIAEVQEATGSPRASVEHSFRSLLLMNFVDGSGAGIVDQ